MTTVLEARFELAGRAAEVNFRLRRHELARVFGQERRTMQDTLLDAALVDAGILSRGDLVAEEEARWALAGGRCASVCGPDGCRGACDF